MVLFIEELVLLLSSLSSLGAREKNVQVLEVATGEIVVGNNLNLALASLADLNVVAEVVGAALNLDAVLEELLEGGGVEDLVASGLLSVDDELGIPG